MHLSSRPLINMKETEEGSSSNLCRSCHKHDVNYTKSTCFRSKSPLETGTLAETALTKTTFWGLITPDLKLLLLRFQTFCHKKSGIWQNGHIVPSGQEVSTMGQVNVDIHRKVWICWNTSISLEGVQLVGETPLGCRTNMSRSINSLHWPSSAPVRGLMYRLSIYQLDID